MDPAITARLSADNRAALARELLPGETLLWAAEPSPGMKAAGCVVWLIALPFTGFGLLWSSVTLLPLLLGWVKWESTGIGIVMALFGLPFLFIGLFMLAMPLRMWRDAKRTIYAFTSKRLLRIIGGKVTQVSEVPVDAIGSVDMIEYSDGSGTLTIQTFGPADEDGERQPVIYQIMGVQDVARARQLLRERRTAA